MTMSKTKIRTLPVFHEGAQIWKYLPYLRAPISFADGAVSLMYSPDGESGWKSAKSPAEGKYREMGTSPKKFEKAQRFPERMSKIRGIKTLNSKKRRFRRQRLFIIRYTCLKLPA
jgi:hypothetical protein